MPDQEKSQEVDLASIVLVEGEWVAWVRSFYITEFEVPEGTQLAAGSVQHLKMAAKCKPDFASIRVAEAYFESPSGERTHTPSDAIESVYPSTDGIEYAANTPGLLCASALAQKHGEPLPWPMSKSEHRAFIRSHQ
ncbi:MAG: hypothetical protein WBP13_05610 [Methylophilaceae bacterium]